MRPRLSLLLLPLLAACSSHPATGSTSGPVTTLPYDGGAVQWDGWAGEFFTRYCVECHSPTAYCTRCHQPGDPRTPDYTQLGPVVANAPVIRCGVAPAQQPGWTCTGTTVKQFPKVGSPPTNPMPSDDDRERIVAWIDGGCP